MKMRIFDKVSECKKTKLSYRQIAIGVFLAGALVTTVGCAIPEQTFLKYYFDGPTLEDATYDADSGTYYLISKSGEAAMVDKTTLYEQRYGIGGNREIKLGNDTYSVNMDLNLNERELAIGGGITAMIGSIGFAVDKGLRERRIRREQEARMLRKEKARQRVRNYL